MLENELENAKKKNRDFRMREIQVVLIFKLLKQNEFRRK